MTPLITEMIQWADKPELSTWFDLGNVTNTEGRRVEANQVLRLPYDLTSIVGRDKNGEKFALLLKLGNESVTVAGFTKTDYRGIGAHGAFGKTLEPFTYMATPEGMRYFKGDSQVSDDEVKQGFRMVCACLLKLHECTEAHQPTVRANSITNKRRIAKGKPPTTTMTAKQALESALVDAESNHLKDVLICGYDEDGILYVRSSRLTCAEALFLANKAMRWAESGGGL